MHRSDGYYIELDDRAEKMLRTAEFLGCGHNGIVYLIPGKKVIKIFRERKVCEKEYNILKRTSKSKYFPKVYCHGTYYIVRDCVEGERLDKYIKNNGLNREISCNIIKLIKEFKKLNFSKLDIRCKDLYVKNDLSLMVIDPKNNYSRECTYPRHLMKGLNNLGVLDEFLEVVKTENNELYNEWNLRMRQYLSTGIK
ncbi:protein kinase [Clostridium lundense]|uniref:protein kinase n=1 Tax=Clostridium lundense TaxID=319475 RepID=UPI000483F74D|nr:protein kinase [Clostridium lundense]